MAYLEMIDYIHVISDHECDVLSKITYKMLRVLKLMSINILAVSENEMYL